MYEILVTEPLRTSECAGDCRFSVKLCKRVLDVTADASVSGRKMKEHLKTFFCQFFYPYLSTNSRVHCGSWSGHKDEQVLLEAFEEKHVGLKIIQSTQTYKICTIYVYFFRQYKNMPRE